MMVMDNDGKNDGMGDGAHDVGMEGDAMDVDAADGDDRKK